MKIISLNTWAGIVFEPLIAFFEAHADTDIFCLQEIYKDAEGKTQPHPELDVKFDLYKHIETVLTDTHVGYFRPAHKDYYGQTMFVRKELLVEEEGDVLIFENKDSVLECRGRHNRNLQYIRILQDNMPLLVANVHGLWNGMGKTDTDERLEQSKRIRVFMESRSERMIVTGDFNLNPDTESLAIISNGLRNLVREYGILSTRTSFYDKEGKFADYMLVSPDVEVLDFKVLPDEVSDHAALCLEIKN